MLRTWWLSIIQWGPEVESHLLDFSKVTPPSAPSSLTAWITSFVHLTRLQIDQSDWRNIDGKKVLSSEYQQLVLSPANQLLLRTAEILRRPCCLPDSVLLIMLCVERKLLIWPNGFASYPLLHMDVTVCTCSNSIVFVPILPTHWYLIPFRDLKRLIEKPAPEN